MTSILVTGGAGFIGSNVCRALLAEGHTVYAVDNFITGSKENLASLYPYPHFYFAEGDIISRDFVHAFANLPIDEIYHFACPTGVPNLKRLATEMLHTCSLGMFNVLEIARMHNAKLLFTSTAEIYGQPEVSPQREDYTGNVSPIGARSAYEEGKRFSEACLAAAVRTHGLDARIVRIFNTYGPGMSLNDFRVIPQFLKSISENRPLRIYGTGEQKRTHLYVDDLVRGLRIAMRDGTPGEAYNVGSETQLTIRELAETLIELSGFTGGIVFEPHFIEDHTQRKPSTEKIRALGWRQEIPIRDGLGRMMDRYIPHLTPVRAESLAPLKN